MTRSFSKDKRQGASKHYIEGRRALAEALEAQIPVKRLLVAADLAQSDKSLVELVRKFERAGVLVQRVARARLDSLSSHGAHQGVMAEVKPYSYASVEDIIARATSQNELVLILDHVTDEGNFGAMVRSAEVVGAAGVIIANARAAQVGVGAYKTSAGAVLHLPIAQVPNLVRAAQQLKDAGFWIAGASEHATTSLWEAPLSGKLALVMGSEGTGISALMQKTCDFMCTLPQKGKTESLNVAQAATVMCYEWLRKTSQP